MNKIFIFLLCSILSIPFLQSQIIFQEDFESGIIPAGWMIQSNATDGDFYSLVPGGRPNTNYIWKLDLNNFAGYWYEIVANENSSQQKPWLIL